MIDGMIERLLIVIAFFSLYCTDAVLAQCIPDSTVTELFSPSAQEGLPDGTIGLPYEAVIHFNIPAETTIVVTAQIDSVEFTDITGLPDSLKYSCNPPSCVFPGGSFACIKIHGTPENKANVGSNDLEVKFTLNTNITDISDKIDDYSIFLNVGTPTIVEEVIASKLKLLVNQNPASNQAKLIFDLPKTGAYSLEVYSLLGAKVFSKSSNGNKGYNSLPIAEFDLEAGMFFVSVNMDGFSNSTRFILQ
tara:strand:- start:2527 stop:3270 length:744 start_codon:yes stop_codon:yes gene_type:complete